jgi:hypothetical protein
VKKPEIFIHRKTLYQIPCRIRRGPTGIPGISGLVIIPGKHIQLTMIPPVAISGMRGLFILVIALTVLSGIAFAHPPAGVAVSFDEPSGDLGVAITHAVDDPQTHFVKHVTVKQGSTVLVDQSYTSQPDTSDFTYRYNLPQLKGTGGEVRVGVDCSIFGSRSGTLTLAGAPAPATPGGAPPPATKAPGCAILAILAIGLVAMRIMR